MLSGTLGEANPANTDDTFFCKICRSCLAQVYLREPAFTFNVAPGRLSHTAGEHFEPGCRSAIKSTSRIYEIRQRGPEAA